MWASNRPLHRPPKRTKTHQDEHLLAHVVSGSWRFSTFPRSPAYYHHSTTTAPPLRRRRGMEHTNLTGARDILTAILRHDPKPNKTKENKRQGSEPSVGGGGRVGRDPISPPPSRQVGQTPMVSRLSKGNLSNSLHSRADNRCSLWRETAREELGDRGGNQEQGGSTGYTSILPSLYGV